MPPEPAPTRKIAKLCVYVDSVQIHLQHPVANRPNVLNLISSHKNYDMFCSTTMLAYAEDAPIAIYFDPESVKIEQGNVSATAVWLLLPKEIPS